MDATHSRRRVLGDLDTNIRSPIANPISSPLKPLRRLSDAAGMKRSLESSQGERPAKKCRPLASASAPAPRTSTSQHSNAAEERSVSPDASSIFDNSVIDTSQATTLTEPDTDTTTTNITTTVGLRTPRPPTREETRQKAEILRLRLGLARYKLRTGQEDVPLERLKVRSVPTPPRLPSPWPSSHESSEGLQLVDQDHDQDHDFTYTWHAGSQCGKVTSSSTTPQEQRPRAPTPPHDYPPLPSLSSTVLDTPKRALLLEQDEERLTSSIIKGGAAKGLLSLARGLGRS